MTAKPKPKRKAGFSLMDFLMPQNPLVHYISPLSPTEIVNLLKGLGVRATLSAKVETIKTPTGTLYKFQIFERKIVQRRRPRRSLLEKAFSDERDGDGELVIQGVLTGLFQATENNQTLFTFNPGRQVMGGLIIAWGLVFLFGIAIVPFFPTVIRLLLAALVLLVGVLAFQLMPMFINKDLGFHFSPGDRLGDLMVLKLQANPLPRKPAAGTHAAEIEAKAVAKAKSKKENL